MLSGKGEKCTHAGKVKNKGRGRDNIDETYFN